MSVSVPTIRRHPTLLAGVLGLALGAMLGLSIAFAISWIGPGGATGPAGTIGSAARPAQVFEALQQQRIREYGAASLPQVNAFEALRRHSLRENGSTAIGLESGATAQQLFQHTLRENANGPAAGAGAGTASAQLFQHTLRENGGQ